MFFEKILSSTQEYKSIFNAIFAQNKTISINGLADIHKAHLVHSLFSHKQSPALCIVHTEHVAQKLKRDLNSMGNRAAIFPSR